MQKANDSILVRFISCLGCLLLKLSYVCMLSSLALCRHARLLKNEKMMGWTLHLFTDSSYQRCSFPAMCRYLEYYYDRSKELCVSCVSVG